jgi:serine/threonine protein kinase
MTLDGGQSKGAHVFSLAVGSLLHEFEVQSVLGHGGFGITYLALDTNLQEQVAIKEYLPNDIGVRVADATVQAKSEGDRSTFEAGLESFLEKARRLVRARHPNVVNVRRFFRLHGTGYIVQNYERGQTLGQRLGSGPIHEDELRRILNGVLDGLEKVHDLPMLHRDIKPSNIILREDGSPVLIDFGAARDFESRNTRSITAMGTEGYSPPEQRGVGGQQGPWTDLYALGATAYHCVTGEAPADALRRLRKDILVPARTAAEGKYSPALLGAIDWMLKIDEAERPVSVSVLREALQSGVIPGDTAPPSVSSVTMKLGVNGSTLLEFDRPIAADVLELAFQLASSGDYLAPSENKAQWSKTPHYFAVNRVSGSSGNLFEVASGIGRHLPPGAEVTISSRDGYVKHVSLS